MSKCIFCNTEYFVTWFYKDGFSDNDEETKELLFSGTDNTVDKKITLKFST